MGSSPVEGATILIEYTRKQGINKHMKGIKTLGATSLVRPRIPNEKKGVIWSPTESKPIIYGEVLIKGKDVPDEYEVGDMIIFGPNSGIRIKLQGQKLMIVRHSDVMGREES